MRFLGKKGRLTEQLKQLGKLPAEDRPAAGQEINRIKQLLQQAIEGRRAALESAVLAEQLVSERIDVNKSAILGSLVLEKVLEVIAFALAIVFLITAMTVPVWVADPGKSFLILALVAACSGGF